MKKMKKAEKNDWKTVEMPLETETFKMDMQLKEEEYKALQNGFIPQQMEDKWFLYFENDTLYIHRSWTGYCIYIIEFSKEHRIERVTVNRNMEQYKNTDREEDISTITILIKAHGRASKQDYFAAKENKEFFIKKFKKS